MKEKRRWKNEWLQVFAQKKGLHTNALILVRERSLLKDGSYITRERRTGVVLKLYPYHFYCLMEDGTKESFRYNEFLGYESRLVRLKGSAEGSMSDQQLNQAERASVGTLFVLQRKKPCLSTRILVRGRRGRILVPVARPIIFRENKPSVSILRGAHSIKRIIAF